MAEQAKLTAISRAWSNKDKEDFSKGLTAPGSLAAPDAKAPAAEPDLNKVDPTQGAYGKLEDDATKAGAANLEVAKTNPGMQEKLNMMAKARAKFYGETK